MNLFVDTISSEWNLILFDDNRKIIDKIIWHIKWNESSLLIPKIDELIKRNNLDYKNLKNIIVVNWPGSFTWVRTTILVINSINFITKNNVDCLSFFDLYDNYPIIKSSSKRDCFFKETKKSEIKILENEKLLNFLNKKNIKKIYWETKTSLFPWIKILEKIDYHSIIKKIIFKNNKKIKPLYIKKPNIS